MTYQELNSQAKILGDKIKLTRKVLEFLTPFAKKGNYERYLADANLFMEFFAHVTIGWIWLEMAVDAQQCLVEKNQAHSREFYESKIHSMKFYFKYELTKTLSLAESLMNDDALTINNMRDIF